MAAEHNEPIQIGSRLEMFVDDWLIDRLSGALRRLHHPVPQEVAMVCDRPWEGNNCGFFTCLRDNGVYRVYFRAQSFRMDEQGTVVERSPAYTCYAESSDGITWTRPSLGLFEAAGTRDNNVVLTPEVAGYATIDFSPFVDNRPGVPPEERYKGVGGLGFDWQGGGLFAFVSPDGINWRKLRDKPVITKGCFDAHNVAFWDAERGEYRAYSRDRRVEKELRGIPGAPVTELKTDDLCDIGDFRQSLHTFCDFSQWR